MDAQRRPADIRKENGGKENTMKIRQLDGSTGVNGPATGDSLVVVLIS